MLFKKKSFRKETRDNFKEMKELLDDSISKVDQMQESVGILSENVSLMLENNRKAQELLEKVLNQSERELVSLRKVL